MRSGQVRFREDSRPFPEAPDACAGGAAERDRGRARHRSPYALVCRYITSV